MRFGVGALVICMATSCPSGLTVVAAEQGKWSVSLPSDARPLEQSERPFFDAYRQAVNTHNVEMYKRLVCPKCLAAINDSNKDDFEERFAVMVGEAQIPVDATVGIVPLDFSAFSQSVFAQSYDFQEWPTHSMQIIKGEREFSVAALAHSGDQWCVVMPSAKASTLATKAHCKEEAQPRVKQLHDPLLSELRELLTAGQTVEAIKRYHEREGVGLCVSNAVIFELLKQSRAQTEKER